MGIVSTMTKRNPCTYRVEKLNDAGYLIKEWTRGYIQDRSIKEHRYLVSPGVGGEIDERWYDFKDVKLTKDHWTNKRPPVSKKSFWRRAK
tara:strand:+ start:248 stop:517 length:270 start_codon:yes stop_codon:yes gene_type:complete